MAFTVEGRRLEDSLEVSAPTPRGRLWLETWSRRESCALLLRLPLFPTSSVPNTLCSLHTLLGSRNTKRFAHPQMCSAASLSHAVYRLLSPTKTPHCPTPLSSSITSSQKPRQLLSPLNFFFFLLSSLLMSFLKARNPIDIVYLTFSLPNRSRLMVGT